MLMLHGAGMPLRPQVGAPDQDADPDDADEADDRYEDELFGLVVHLEHLREGMVGARVPQVLALGIEMMDQVVALADRYGPIASLMPGSDPTEARAAEFRAALKALQEPTRGYGNNGPPAAGRCYVALYEAVFANFVIFTNRFPTSRAARGWVEVAATFVTELKRTLRDLDRSP